MSINTIVVIVIAMTMLILGIVLVRTIFTGAINNIDELTEGVEDEVRKLFTDDNDRVVVYLNNKKADVDQGDSWGLGFAIRNIDKGTSEASAFTWDIVAAPNSCAGLTPQEAESWIQSRGSGSVQLSPGDIHVEVARFVFPETAPLCVVPYDLIVSKNGQPYDQVGFDFIIG